MPPKDWKPRSAIEFRFYKALRRIKPFIANASKSESSLEGFIRSILKLVDSKEWQAIAQAEAMRMVKNVIVENAQTWREAARRGQRSREIHQLLKAEVEHGRFGEIVRANAELIRTVPERIARTITERVGEHAIAGARAESIIEAVRKEAPDLAEYQLRRIARTEVAKTQSAITQVRSEQIGVDWYVWRTSEDQRVRSSHDHMHGVLCRFSSPPAPEELNGEESQGHYGPGGIYNCRCYAEPVIDIEFLTPPYRVHHQGRIQRMSRKQFVELT